MYCSNACRQKAYRDRHSSSIPQKMKNATRWVRCDGKKRPVSPDGALLLWSSPNTWRTYSNVKRNDYGMGMGFVLGDGIGVIDLDYCVRADGTLSPLAEAVLERNPDAWVEWSQSGRGLHIWGLLDGDTYVKERGFEVYSGNAKRFMWVTGKTYRRGCGRMVPLDTSL